MDEYKSFFASRTIWAAIAIALFSVLKGAGMVPEAVDQTQFTEAFYVILAFLIVWFRKKANTKIGKPD